MKERSAILVSVALLFLAGTATHAPAQAGYRELPPGKWWKTARIVRALNLTPEQQQKIESLWGQNRRNLVEFKSVLDKSHIELSDLLSHSPVDEAAALRALEQAAVARQAIDRSTLIMRIRIKSILTPEQQTKFEELSLRLRGERQSARGTGNQPRRPGNVRP